MTQIAQISKQRVFAYLRHRRNQFDPCFRCCYFGCRCWWSDEPGPGYRRCVPVVSVSAFMKDTSARCSPADSFRPSGGSVWLSS